VGFAGPGQNTTRPVPGDGLPAKQSSGGSAVRQCVHEEVAASVAARYKFTRSVASLPPPAAAPTPFLITPNQPKPKTQTALLLPIPDVAGAAEAGAASKVSHPRPAAACPFSCSPLASGREESSSASARTSSRVSMRPPRFLSPVSRLKFGPDLSFFAYSGALRCDCRLLRSRPEEHGFAGASLLRRRPHPPTVRSSCLCHPLPTRALAFKCVCACSVR
jgi:hypothetical protein